MRGGLPRDDQLVGDSEELEEVRIELGAGVRGDRDICLHGGVVLGVGMGTLRDEVDHPTLGDRPLVELHPNVGHQVVPGGTDEAVRWPDHQVITTVGLEGADVLKVPALLGRVCRAPNTLFDIGDGDDGKRRRRISLAVDPHARMCNVNGLVGVESEVKHLHSRPDAGDEPGHTAGVDVGAGDEQCALGIAEIDLPIDAEDVDTLCGSTHEKKRILCFYLLDGASHEEERLSNA